MTDFCFVLFFFCQLLSKAATSDTELKAKHVRELLKLTTKFINEAKKTENVRTLYQVNAS